MSGSPFPPLGPPPAQQPDGPRKVVQRCFGVTAAMMAKPDQPDSERHARFVRASLARTVPATLTGQDSLSTAISSIDNVQIRSL